MAHRIVPFEGQGAGSGPLSWGQRELWGAMQRQKTWMPLRSVEPLPEGTTVEAVAADLRFLMSRYPSMRTRLRLDPDGPTQVVSGAGEVPLEIVDAGPDADPAEVAARVGQRYWDADYDFATEWPVRMAVVRHRGVPTHLVWVMCHLVTDGFGAAVMLSELAERTNPSAAATPPLAQARWQQSPAGRRQCRTVLRQWESVLRTVPARRFPEPAARPSPRYWHASFRSPATQLAVRAIAARTGADSSPVLLAAFVGALARVTGIDPVVVRVVVSNRFRPGLAETVSPITQTGLLVVDAAGRDFDSLLSQVRRRAMAAYKHAYYDPAQLDALIARVCRHRGEEVDIGCFFNDRRLRRSEPATGPLPTPEQVRDALPDTSFRWEDKQDGKPYERLFLHVDDVPGTVALSVFADTHHLSPADLERCVRTMEAVAVAAAVPGEAGPR